MNLLTKLTNVKTSTLVVATILLSALICLSPFISFAVGDLGSWLLSTAASSGPYRFADKELFKLLEDIYRAFWGIGVQFFSILTAVQLLIIIPLGFYLSRILYKRYKAGVAKLWQFWVPVAFICFAPVFILSVLYMSYVEVNSWDGVGGQVDSVNDVIVPEDVVVG